MTLKCGIVGLPNVGKSTLFNALTASSNAMAANYPFCTIEPNSGIVAIPDERLEILTQIANAKKIIPTFIEFVDIAGLVAGASKGEGLGNQFLSHIRQVDAILHVVRCFEDPDIIHVNGKVNPLNDLEIIETELILADLESVEKRLTNISKKCKSGDKTLLEEQEILTVAYDILKEGRAARELLSKYDAKKVAMLQLLTTKPVLYICNVLESEAVSGNNFTNAIKEYINNRDAEVIVVSSKIEAEIATLEDKEEKAIFLGSLGLNETGLSQIIKTAYRLLDLRSFFTVGEKEAHAWTFINGTKAPAAAGIIHSDFEDGFIRAEVIAYSDYVECNGELQAKSMGKMRLEGKEYVMQDGDVVHFRFNV